MDVSAAHMRAHAGRLKLMHMSTNRNPEPLWRAFKRYNAGADTLLHYFGVDEPPVDVEGMAGAMGVEVHRFYEERDWSGAMDASRPTPIIWVRAADHWTRQRFTIAHELGHLLLHDDAVLWRDDTFSGSWKERQANQFAADLLMPAAMVRSQALRHGRSPSRLAALFEVSPAAMTVRLKNLRIR